MYTRMKIFVIFRLRLLKSGWSLKLGVLYSAVSSSSTGQINIMNKGKNSIVKTVLFDLLYGFVKHSSSNCFIEQSPILAVGVCYCVIWMLTKPKSFKTLIFGTACFVRSCLHPPPAKSNQNELYCFQKVYRKFTVIVILNTHIFSYFCVVFESYGVAGLSLLR